MSKYRVNPNAFKYLFWFFLSSMGMMIWRLFEIDADCTIANIPLLDCQPFKLILLIIGTTSLLLISCAFFAGWFGYKPAWLFEIQDDRR